MEFISELGLFTAKTILIVGGILIVLAAGFYFAQRGKGQAILEIEKLNERFRDLRNLLKVELLNPKQLKEFNKAEKKARKKEQPKASRVFVLDFDGDIRATGVASLREEVTSIISAADAKLGDQVVLRLESPGGMVHSYGLAASQLARLKNHGLKLTICVDKIAASGGYMMACVADKIVAAPFAVIGSIGVVAQVPNFHKVLQNHDVEYREVTAGQYKRTVSMLGEITPEGMEKFKSQLEDTHVLFKQFVSQHRPQLDVAQVATGEHWYGSQALPLKLIDEVKTSDDVLFELHENSDLFRVQYHIKKSLSERLSNRMAQTLQKTFELTLHRFWDDLEKLRFGR